MTGSVANCGPGQRSRSDRGRDGVLVRDIPDAPRAPIANWRVASPRKGAHCRHRSAGPARTQDNIWDKIGDMRRLAGRTHSRGGTIPRNTPKANPSLWQDL
jgi:hypothetical protein